MHYCVFGDKKSGLIYGKQWFNINRLEFLYKWRETFQRFYKFNRFQRSGDQPLKPIKLIKSLKPVSSFPSSALFLFGYLVSSPWSKSLIGPRGRESNL
ncbi:MAG: hypothetical protein DI535_18010 [Citrobacter freundii]|nr:MAG: hypothetical protein DI535_18010 [Citrobacter freundii]